MDPADARTPLLAVAFAPKRGGRGLAIPRGGPAPGVPGTVGVSPSRWFTYVGLQRAWQLGSIGRGVVCVTVPRTWGQKYPRLPGVVLKHLESYVVSVFNSPSGVIMRKAPVRGAGRSLIPNTCQYPFSIKIE